MSNPSGLKDPPTEPWLLRVSYPAAGAHVPTRLSPEGKQRPRASDGPTSPPPQVMARSIWGMPPHSPAFL